ncbi:MAG: hypothetical protein ABEL97_06050 [Salinibacter sp.]
MKVRITPWSLLRTSVLGATVLGGLCTGGLLLLPTGILPVEIQPVSEAPAALLSQLGPVLLFTFGVLLPGIFVAGYRRHGRPVPTDARVLGNVLAVRVPEAWGTLIREEIHLHAPRLERPHVGGPPDPGQGESRSERPPSGPLLAIGTAPEWWDPGTYEVHAKARAVAVLEAGLVDDNAEGPVR